MMPLTRSLLVLLACGCARGAQTSWQASGPEPVPVERIALAPAQVLGTLDGADPVRTGTAVGHVLFGGGYITEDHPTGQQNVSGEAKLDATNLYTEHAIEWAETSLRDALAVWGDVEPTALAAPPTRPLMRALRGDYDDLGRDNQPLPRFAVEPVDLEPGTLPADLKADVVIIPWVVRWYTHNGGWFLGQTWGSAAGARTRVIIAAHDARDGRVLGWSDIEAHWIHDAEFNPNSAAT
ncbi:MAG: hypothetical protein ACI8PZ_004040, partial [Myxococcota bacterium]